MTAPATRRWFGALALLTCTTASFALAAEAATFAEIYAARCAGCHGRTGLSDTPSARALKVAPLVDDERVAAMTPAEIVADIRANPKHRAVVDFTHVSDAELLAAAAWVRRLCASH